MPNQVNILHLYFLKFPHDNPNLLKIFSFLKFNNYCRPFFLLILWQVSIRSEEISQPGLPKILRTFFSKTCASTSLRIPITSKHPLLEYWAFTQHWRSIFVHLFDKSEFDAKHSKKHQITYKFLPIHACWPRQI